MNDRIKLAAIIIAAFTAGELHMRRKNVKSFTAFLEKDRLVRHNDGWSDGWRAALADNSAVKLAYSKLNRSSVLDYGNN